MSAIELASPRVIYIEDRKQKYNFTVSRITDKLWLRYFEGIVSTSETQGGNQIDSFDTTAARLDLVNQVLTDAHGYKFEGKITDIVEWKSALPLAHRLGIANALVDAQISDMGDEEPITLGRESIYLDSLWSADEYGNMVKYHGLRHSFYTPNAEQQRRYSRESRRSRVIGGSRKGKTQWLGSQPVLMALYDELIREVEGYTVNGEPLTGTGEIARNMDGYHKVVAAGALFSAASPVGEEL